MPLLKNGLPVPTFFNLMGDKENDMTAGLAYVLSRSPVFLRKVFKELFGNAPREVSATEVSIQTNRPGGGGITDIELKLVDKYYAIIEAKRGLEIPSLRQLKKYAPHVTKVGATNSLLVSLSNTARLLADTKLPSDVRGVPVTHRSWRRIKKLADASVPQESNTNKRLLREFSKYLGELIGMENIYSNMVYVVSLARGNPKNWDISWIDTVEKKKCYFY